MNIKGPEQSERQLCEEPKGTRELMKDHNENKIVIYEDYFLVKQMF